MKYLLTAALAATSIISAAEEAPQEKTIKQTLVPVVRFERYRADQCTTNNVLVGATYTAERAVLNSYYWDASATLLAGMGKLDCPSISMTSIGFDVFAAGASGSVGYAFLAPYNVSITPYATLEGVSAWLDGRGFSVNQCCLFGGVGFKASYPINPKYSIGLRSEVNHMLAQRYAGNAAKYTKYPKVSENWGYKVSVSLTWSSDDTRVSMSVEPSLSTRDWEECKGSFGLGLKSSYAF